MEASPDLTQRPPRSARVRLGGYVLLARCLDKGRASLAGKNGDYSYNCPLDRRFFDFTGVSAEALLEELRAGKGDGEILTWIEAHAAKKREAWEISAWSAAMEQRAPGGVESRDFLQGEHRRIAPERSDIVTIFDLLDLDDYVTFGGRP